MQVFSLKCVTSFFPSCDTWWVPSRYPPDIISNFPKLKSQFLCLKHLGGEGVIGVNTLQLPRGGIKGSLFLELLALHALPHT